MKNKKHNTGELKELKVKIDKSTVETIHRMASNTGQPVEELVVVALKRFITHHSDYEIKDEAS